MEREEERSCSGLLPITHTVNVLKLTVFPGKEPVVDNSIPFGLLVVAAGVNPVVEYVNPLPTCHD